MKKLTFAICGALLGLASAAAAAEMDRSTPEAEGVSSKAIDAWIDACERELDAMHGFVIVRHGKTIAEGWWSPFSADRTHMLYSHSKSFTSTAAGFLADEGKLDLDEPVASIFPDKLPPNPSVKLLSLRVRDILTMNTGMPYTDPQRKDPAGEWVKLFLANEVKDNPGTVYRYDSCATYMVAAIVEKKTGRKLMDYLGEKLFRPIGIEKAWTTTSPQGIACGGWGMNMTTRELARFGQFYLQQGRWGGRQLLSKKWVNLATSYQTSTMRSGDGDWNQGYGFQFWRCRHNCYRADGAFGQYTVVMPEQDAVVSLHAGLGPMDKELDLVWKYLLPAMKAEALLTDPAAEKALADRCAKLKLRTSRVLHPDFNMPAPSDVLGKTYALTGGNRFKFDSVRLEAKAGGWEAVFTRPNGPEIRFPFGAEDWCEGESYFEPYSYEALGGLLGNQPLAGSGAWKDHVFSARVYAHNTTFRFDFMFDFKTDGKLVLDVNLFGMNGGRWKLDGQIK